MEKEKILQKLKAKDYNKELEELLLKKSFPKNTKNLLSSMLYKIENSYEDYKKIKVEVASKKDFLEELIEIICNDCNEIEIIKPKLEEDVLNGEKSIAIKEDKKIITYQNELAILEAIYDLNTNKFKEDGELEERAVFIALNEGEKVSKSEIIRDFDGWSWNIMIPEIKNYIPNLIYQSLIFLLGYNTLYKNKKIKRQELELMLKENFKSPLAEKILKSLTQLAIINYINKNPYEKTILLEIEDGLKKKFALMEEKKTYIEEITKQKIQYIKEIENIDKYINDDLKLKREYIKQNEKLPQEQRVFSLSDFSEKIEAKRIWLEKEINNLTEKLKPKNFVKEKDKLEKDINFIKELNSENYENITKEFINSVLKAINTQIEKIEIKKEVIDKIYILRYLKSLNINEKTTVGILCKKSFQAVEKNLITTACNLKTINIFSKDVEENYKIYKNIFNTKIIDLESAYIEISKENIVQIYDENSLEKEEKLTEIKELSVKYNKKIRIFL